MNYQYRLSVIVPCYNVEPHLDLSLSCLEKQWDDESLEFIFINDCSSDGTLDKLEAFRNRHPSNTVIINKTVNEGVSTARNDGLQMARGEWVTFFDSDDALAENTYKSLCENYLDDKVNILSFKTNIIWSSSKFNHPVHVNGDVEWEGDGREFFKKFLTNVTWIFIYKHDLIQRLGASFRRLTFLEDTLFNFEVFLNEGVYVRRVDSKSHYYIMHTGSLSNVETPGRQQRMADDMMQVLQIMQNKKQTLDDGELVDRVVWKQRDIALRFVPLFMRCESVDLSAVRNIRRQLFAWGVYPYSGISGGTKRIMNDILFRFPRLLRLSRPLLLWLSR